MAVALAERSAEVVSFRWHQPSLPPHKNVHSAVSPLIAAVQFSGNIAIYATTATFWCIQHDSRNKKGFTAWQTPTKTDGLFDTDVEDHDIFPKGTLVGAGHEEVEEVVIGVFVQRGIRYVDGHHSIH